MKIMLLLFCVALTAASHAIEVRLSVKFVLTGSGPALGTECDSFGDACSNIGSEAGFQAEVDRANGILRNGGRGYQLRVVEFLTIRPNTPPGQSSSYWFDLDARKYRVVMEAAAMADKATWRWHETAINVFVNNSSSGQCSLPGTGLSLSLGKQIGTGTVLHEIGHLMGLDHTHSGDADCPGNLTSPLSQYTGDGDGLPVTLPDSLCFTEMDQLGRANFNDRHLDRLSAAELAAVNATWFNVMSYHQEDVLLPDQLDIWSDNANASRQSFCNGRTVFADSANACYSALPPGYDNYAWWVEMNPLPAAPAPGSSHPLSVTIDPSFPRKPPLWPNAIPWPPVNPPDTPPPYYPGNWPWPPVNLPAITFCMGGPRQTFAEALDQAASGDIVLIRPGTYHEARRITKRVSLRATRGNAAIR